MMAGISTPALEFTGERYVPGVPGEIAHEHWHRYAFARRFVLARRVLDIACGEGYGSALLAEAAAHVIGIDIDTPALAHARAVYADRPNLTFVQASAATVPLRDASVDVVVSFETIEHIRAEDQPRMLAEFARVLVPDGLLIISSPNRPQYSEARKYVNPFHLSELDRGEFAKLLDPHFPVQRWHRQRRYLGSALWAENPNANFEALCGTSASAAAAELPPAMYFVVLAAHTVAGMPEAVPSLSLFTDQDDAELARIDHEAREVLRLDALLIARDAELRRQQALRDELIASQNRREEEATRLNAECERLAREIASQERIAAYRESVHWWLKLPLVRARRLWKRIRPA
jgi:SAM-dependent methyltransferase